MRKGYQIATETIAFALFFLLSTLPLARVGILDISATLQVDLLILVSLLLILEVVLFLQVRYRSRAPLEVMAAVRRRDDAIMSALSVSSGVLVALIVAIEVGALLVFLNVLGRTDELVVAVASYFTLFNTFALLALDLLLVARTSFETRHKPRPSHRPVAWALLTLTGFFALVAALKNHALLAVGPFADIRPEQSGYLLSLGVLVELVAYRLLLRYPPISVIFRKQIEMARRATRQERDLMERRALRAYILGLGFLMISIILLGTLATGQISPKDARATNFILVPYAVTAVVILVVLVARYIQHKHVWARKRREQRGELIAQRRLTPEQTANIIIYSTSGFFALILFAMGVLTFLEKSGFPVDYGTDFLIASFVVGVGPFGFRRGIEMHRIRAMDEKFPDLLRDLAEGLRAGMTLPRALKTASKGVYGALTPEIQQMSAQVEWGVSFTESLERFAARVRTPLIQRTVSLVNEASRAGGSVVDILTAAAMDAREIQQILEDRRRQMSIYSVIIYVSFFVFLLVAFILAAQFLPSFETAIRGAGGAQVGGLSFQPFEAATYERIFFHAALFQGIGGGLVAGVMTEGHPLGGLKHSFVMTLVSWVFFRGFL